MIRKNILCLFVSFIAFHPYSEEVEKAVKLLKNEKSTVLQIKNTSNTEGSEALSIVFPEMIRWSAFRNMFETKANELLYVKDGKAKADFSIGHFQMKPSFVESLESYVESHQNLQTFSYVVITNKTIKEARTLRLERMKQLAWQLRYAHVYWLVAMDRFKDRKFESVRERVRFFATAYNYGFEKPEKDVEAWQKKAAFPFGSKSKVKQVSFGNLAVEFYENFSKEFEK